MNELLRRILFLPPQASTIASSVDHLHYAVILTTMGGATLITFVGLYFVIRYRRRPNDGEPPREQPAPPAPPRLEAAVIIGLLSLFVVWWVVGFSQYVRMRTPPKNTLDIYVTAKQWMWKFSYADGNHTIGTLYVPSGRPVKLIMTSRDVIHSFFVPDFRLKQDVLPGRYTTMWFEVDHPGTHPVFCAEFCGVGHSTMRAEVVVLDPADYTRWLAGARKSGYDALAPANSKYVEPATWEDFPAKNELNLVRMGEQAAGEHGCLRCHTLDGTPHIGPTWAGLYLSTIPLQDGGTAIADEAYLTESMMDPAAKIHRGFPPVMPSYHGLIRPPEVAAILQLIKALRDEPNRPLEVKPSQIAAPPPPPNPAGAIGQPPPTPQQPEPMPEDNQLKVTPLGEKK